jgi:DNA-binding LacI/PurR family transcriptional regulator
MAHAHVCIEEQGMRVSIKDIAKSAGVSHSTVSRALSNSPLIPAATRRRIERLARKMGYSPNAIARGLVTRRTKTIGVVVTFIDDPFAAQVVRGIEEMAADNGYRVFLGTSHNDPVREVSLVQALREWSVEGVIVASSRVGALYQPLLTEIGTPIVLINNQNRSSRPRPGAGSGEIHSVVFDDIRGGELATQYLISQGHRVIAYLGGPGDYAENRKRLAGYRRALASAHIPFDPALVCSGSGRVDSGILASDLVALPASPTAIFCYNDMAAIGAMAALKQAGRRVPEDVSVVGFDDIAFSTYVDPPLTTVHQPKEEMGRIAMQMLLDLLSRNKVADVVVPGILIVRESACARMAVTTSSE